MFVQSDLLSLAEHVYIQRFIVYYVADLLHVRLLIKEYGSYSKGYGCLSRYMATLGRGMAP